MNFFVKYCFFRPYKHTMWGVRTLLLLTLSLLHSILCSLPAFGYLLYSSESHCIEIDQPVQADDWKRLRQHDVTEVRFWEGGDEHLFDDPHTFSNLKEVMLSVDGCDYPGTTPLVLNDYYTEFTQIQRPEMQFPATEMENLLRALSQNYPHINSLTISRKRPFTSKELQFLKNFSWLNDLGIYGPIQNTCTLQAYLPQGISELSLERSNLSANNGQIALPRLRNLTLSDCHLTKKLLEQLKFPSMETIVIRDVIIDDDLFKTLKKFRHLQKIDLIRTPVTVEKLEQWHQPLSVTIFHYENSVHETRAVRAKRSNVTDKPA